MQARTPRWSVQFLEISEFKSEFSRYNHFLIPRQEYLRQLEVALARAPVTALLGPRQSGKTTLARQIAANRSSNFFDLESEPDLRRLVNPELALGNLEGLIVLDEVQREPSLFNVLRVLADRPGYRSRFLVLGSASPELVRGVSESLAGRVEFVELSGLDLAETEGRDWRSLWLRGGLPRSYLAASDSDSFAWRENFVRTFLERDIQQLGRAPASAAMRRFWTMLAHWHGQTLNASSLGRSMSVSDKTVRRYLDLLTGTFMVRQLQPWFENVAKRQVKAPKVYFRDSGLLHALLDTPTEPALFSNPKVGASWEGFAIEQTLRALRPANAWFWAAHSGPELDLLVAHNGMRVGFEMKFNEAPVIRKPTRILLDLLNLAHLFLVCPVRVSYAVDERITVLSAVDVTTLRDRLDSL